MRQLQLTQFHYYICALYQCCSFTVHSTANIFPERARRNSRSNQRRDTNTLCLQSFVYVCGSHRRPLLRGEWIRMNGNKSILFRSQLTCGSGSSHGNLKRELVEFYCNEKQRKKLIVRFFKYIKLRLSLNNSVTSLFIRLTSFQTGLNFQIICTHR